MDDIVLPPGYDPADDLSLLLNFFRDCYAPGPVQVALPRLLEATRLSCMSQIPAPTPTPFPSDQIKEIVYTEVEKILKEVKASFADKPAPAADAAPRSYAEAAAKGRPLTTPGELRVHPRAMREVTFRVPATNTRARSLTPAQIVQKAKAATCSSSVLAARRLLSGDVVLSFDTKSSKD